MALFVLRNNKNIALYVLPKRGTREARRLRHSLLTYTKHYMLYSTYRCCNTPMSKENVLVLLCDFLKYLLFHFI